MINFFSLFAISLVVTFTANAGTNTPAKCSQVSRTEARAKAGIFDGSLCKTEISDDEYHFELTLPANNFRQVYHVKNAVCFGAVVVSGCMYKPAGWFNTIKVSTSTEYKCRSETTMDAVTTTFIADVPFYEYSIVERPCPFPSVK